MAEFSKEINSKFPNQRIKALLNVKFTANYFDTLGNDYLKPFKISEQQYNILRILRGAAPNPINAGTIKDRMVNPKSDVTRLMDRLVDKGFIDRKLRPDNRRQMHITISTKGLQILDKIAPLLSKLLENYQDGLSDHKKVSEFLEYLYHIQEQTNLIINPPNE